MKVLFTNPPWIVESGNNTLWGVRAGSRWPHLREMSYNYCPFPFFMSYAAANLKKSPDHEVGIYDGVALRHNYRQFYNYIKSYQPDIIVLEVHQPTFFIDCNISNKLKLLDCRIIWAGPYPTMHADKLIKLPFIDAIVKGEYDLNIHKAITEDGVFDYKIVEEINDLPFPMREGLPIKEYKDYFAPQLSGFQISLMGSRGCPYHCSFCLYPSTMYNNKFRARSVDNIMLEVDYIAKKYNPASLYFDDDTFNIGPDRIRDLAVSLGKFGKPWGAMCRADTTPLQDWAKLYKGGLRAVKFGVESAIQSTVDLIGKKLKLESVKEAVAECKRLGIFVHLTFCYNAQTDDELKMEISAARKFCKEVQPDTIQESKVRIYDETPLGNNTAKTQRVLSIGSNIPKISIIAGLTEDYKGLYENSSGKILKENSDVEYVAVFHDLNNGGWNECICKNYGASKAKSDILVFTNADIIIRKELLEYVKKVIEHDKMNYIMALRVDDLSPNVPFRHVLYCGPMSLPFPCGDFVACHKELFNISRGFNEEMKGWGYLDRDFLGKLNLVGGKFVLAPYFVYHQSHPRHDSESDENENIEIGKIAGTVDGIFQVKSAYWFN